LPHLSGLYNDEVPSTIEGSCSRVNFPASQCGVGPGNAVIAEVESSGKADHDLSGVDREMRYLDRIVGPLTQTI
jgi:hypothetical protein